MSLNVMVVDDSLVMRAMVLKTLHLAGLPIGEVYEASNGREGLELLEKNWVDLIFADINMPVMSGEEMIEQIRANPLWSDLPIVVISTEGSQTRIERFMQKGICFIHKPFTPEVVREVVNAIIVRSDHAQQT